MTLPQQETCFQCGDPSCTKESHKVRGTHSPFAKPESQKCSICNSSGHITTEHDAETAPAEHTEPRRLNSSVEELVKTWSKDDRLWTTVDTVEFNLRVFARAVLSATWCDREAEAQRTEGAGE